MSSPFILDAENCQVFYRYAYALCVNEDEAYELLQGAIESYLTIAAKSNSGQSIYNPPAYIRTLIRNNFIDKHRYQARWQQEAYEESASYDISPVDIEHFTITQQQANNLWQRLNPRDRDLLYHWAILGHSTDEVCELCDIARGTFLSRMHRLRKTLKKHDAEQDTVTMNNRGGR